MNAFYLIVVKRIFYVIEISVRGIFKRKIIKKFTLRLCLGCYGMFLLKVSINKILFVKNDEILRMFPCISRRIIVIYGCVILKDDAT